MYYNIFDYIILASITFFFFYGIGYTPSPEPIFYIITYMCLTQNVLFGLGGDRGGTFRSSHNNKITCLKLIA